MVQNMQELLGRQTRTNVHTSTNPRHSMYAIYAEQLGWFGGSIDRHIFSAMCRVWECFLVHSPPTKKSYLQCPLVLSFHSSTIPGRKLPKQLAQGFNASDIFPKELLTDPDHQSCALTAVLCHSAGATVRESCSRTPVTLVGMPRIDPLDEKDAARCSVQHDQWFMLAVSTTCSYS